MKNILYIQVGKGFWHPNQHVIHQLKTHFPNHTIELFDVMVVAKKDMAVMLTNLVCVFWEYFFDFLAFRKNVFRLKSHFLGTSFLFKQLSRLVREHIDKKDYDFIFQTQSMCDSHNPKGIPVFLYTDHTNLNNHHYAFAKPSEFVLSKHYVALEKKTYENAKLIFVMSENIQASLVNQYHIAPEKIKLVYVSTNTVIAGVANSSQYQNKNILFVGKDWSRKGGPLLVEAFKLVRSKIPDARLTILGCQPDIKEENCTTQGEVSLEIVAKAYQQATVFCMPTQREPFGIVFLEAMFNRLPVITNNTGATPYIVEHGKSGFLLNNDVQQYADVLAELLKNPAQCQEMGNRSYEIASLKYTWENVGNLMAVAIKQHFTSHESVPSFQHEKN
jgi:glycosyltransferase involved in cell wall biosynthesis